MRSTRGWAAVVVMAIATLSAGCAGSTSGPAPGPASAPATAGATPAGLPSGITELGPAVPVAAQGWTLAVAPFQEAGTSSGEVPAGWAVLRTTATFTNTSDRITLLPDTALTVRYGPLGRQAVPVKDQTLSGLPAHDAATKVAPGASYTAEIGVAVPPQGLGQRVTVTAEATQEGMAEADDLFFEGTLPGSATPASGSPEPTGTTPASPGPVLPFGTWSPAGLRISPITLGPDKDGKRTATADLTVTNDGPRPRPGLGITLRVMTGAGLTDAATVTPSLDYPDAPIAPSRSATATVRFTLPSSAVPGPVTVEALDHGDRITFSGTLG
ncbi:hypothetical protein [Streptomyces sp. A 4/2]|uniref:hypothetical protein n=1 Tax=Streptomyces sp. A 4/2 TaxID=2934314 RepID=UPI002024A1B4|nr:hypothetical protein [Streptomyces sp. A 4/2]